MYNQPSLAWINHKCILNGHWTFLLLIYTYYDLLVISITIGRMYSLPLLPSIYISLTLGLSAILPKHGCYFKQLLIYINKSAKYLEILLLLTCEEVLHAPTVQIWAQSSTILTPNNLPIVCHSSITNWSQKCFFFRNGSNFPISRLLHKHINLEFWKKMSVTTRLSIG